MYAKYLNMNFIMDECTINYGAYVTVRCGSSRTRENSL